MKVIVTGAAGFIGSHVVDRLLKDGHDVAGLDNFDPFYDPIQKRDNLTQALGNPRFELVEGDIRDFGLLTALFDRFQPKAVIHLAAKAGVRPSLEDPALYMDVNVTGTTRVFEAARLLGQPPRVVYASSSSVYGDRDMAPFRESENVDSPISPYAASKRACEILASTFHHLYGLNLTGLRFFTAYGPRNRPDLAVSKFSRLILEDQTIPVFGDGSTRRDYTYVEDIADGVVKAMHQCHGLHLYNLGNSSPVALTELISTIAKALGRVPRLKHLPTQPGDVRQTFADISLAETELGFRPSMDFAEGIQRYVEWLLARQGA
ncbi:MAG: NAD-dependent epimerase/dehydratase family protein [Planctomycetota bacterium]|nr:MAG: NAD-dependent epimerase/dehydratase family protein [Planctomycetota bacterium]